MKICTGFAWWMVLLLLIIPEIAFSTENNGNEKVVAPTLSEEINAKFMQ